MFFNLLEISYLERCAAEIVELKVAEATHMMQCMILHESENRKRRLMENFVKYKEA